MRHLIVGTAGHIDHGKSALVKALTGTDPDRLQQERDRGITIELGFADLRVGGDVVSVVDVPGHERFVRHMVAGATGIDAVVLVIAADEGVKPQTREHVDICELLGVRQGVVALSKSDLVDPELLEVVRLEVREYLAGSFLADSAIIAVSSRTGDGLDELRSALGEILRAAPEPAAGGLPRLPVDRSFVLHGFGTVVTGSLHGGQLSEGDEVEILPAGVHAKVRGLQVHGGAVRRARSGQRTAVNLAGVERRHVPRGSVLVRPGSFDTTRHAWVRVRLLAHVPDKLRRGGPVQFHHGTADTRARLRIRETGATGCDAEVFLHREMPLSPGDGFILRRPAPLNTVGGGTVLDAAPPRRRPTADDFRALRAADPVAVLGYRIAREGTRGVQAPRLARAAAVDLKPLLASLEKPAADGRIVRAGDRLFDRSAWLALREKVESEIDAFHRAEPLQGGIGRETLRVRTQSALPQDVWREVLESLQREGALRLSGDHVAAVSHRVDLGGDDRRLADRLLNDVRAAGLNPPDTKVLLEGEDVGRARRILDILQARGELVRLKDGRYFDTDAVAALRARLAEFARSSPTIDIGTFKELAGVSRKSAIPLLEHFDAERFTRRVGDRREIRPGRDG